MRVSNIDTLKLKRFIKTRKLSNHIHYLDNLVFKIKKYLDQDTIKTNIPLTNNCNQIVIPLASKYFPNHFREEEQHDYLQTHDSFNHDDRTDDDFFTVNY